MSSVPVGEHAVTVRIGRGTWLTGCGREPVRFVENALHARLNHALIRVQSAKARDDMRREPGPAILEADDVRPGPGAHRSRRAAGEGVQVERREVAESLP